MIDLRDVPVLGRFAIATGGVLDLVLHSGEFVFVVVDFLLANLELVFPIVRTLESLANRVPWLPESVFQGIVTAGLFALLVIEVGRLGQSALKRT